MVQEYHSSCVGMYTRARSGRLVIAVSIIEFRCVRECVGLWLDEGEGVWFLVVVCMGEFVSEWLVLGF